MMSPKTPEERVVIARDRAVMGRKLAIAARLLTGSEIGIGESIVRTAATEKAVKAYFTIVGNNYNSAEEAELYQERGRKLAIAAGAL